MATSNAVWGIDIGQCALKALRCRPHDKDPTRIVAESFDYIEYPKILSQPEADRVELISEAIAQFVSRNDLRGDRVAISVPGQTGLARFIKLPPVESKKIPDIVKYEARQQIPFALEDVVWDYQQLAGGSEEDGFVLETEVGLFAMKKDQVTRSLQPFMDAGISVDYIQLAPLSIYNYLCFDELAETLEQPYNPEDPTPSTVIISLGTDTTDLVVTNGYRVWQRNIPIGGSHFTKALSKDLKLTFSKAEHLKRHATQADDPKAVFQAMRPVFSDLLAEIQRSIGYFTSIDKKAKIGGVVALGNAMKLPGLQRYLSQNLEHDVRPITEFKHLVGGSVIAGPQFKDNVLSFAVPYGLCVQGLDRAALKTNLLPEEIVTQRLIRAKKPWVVAGIAALLVGCMVNYAATFSSLKSADIEGDNSPFKAPMSAASSTATRSTQLQGDFTTVQADFQKLEEIGKNLVSNVEGRLLWLEVLEAINAALPHDDTEVDESALTPEELANAISARRELQIEQIDCQKFADLATWYTPQIAQKYAIDASGGGPVEAAEVPATEPGADGGAVDGAPAGAAPGGAPADAAETPSAEPDPAAAPETPLEATAEVDALAAGAPGAEGTGDAAPTGPGWVIQLVGHHFHNGTPGEEGAVFVRDTLIKNLREGSVMLPDPTKGGELVETPIKDLGISHPVLVQYGRLHDVFTILEVPDDSEPTGGDGRGAGPGGRDGAMEPPPQLKLRRFEFVVQFSWVPTPPTERALKASGAASDGALASAGAADNVE